MRKISLKVMTILLCLFVAMMIMPQQTYALNATSDRIAGDDRYETCAAIAQSGWNTSYYAILASGEDFPDALCAAPLASKYNAPILLSTRNHLEKATKNELMRLNVKKVMIIGGEGVISASTEKEIRDLGIDVSRLAGKDRYETSLKVAKAMDTADKAVIASGEDFPDVLSIAPIAARKGMPILLTPSNSLAKEHKDFLGQSVLKTYVLGDSSVISDSVVNQLPSPQRLSGINRYDANIEIIKAFDQDLDLSTCYVATGKDYPDALSGAALASLTKSPVILVGDPLDHATEAFIQNNTSVTNKVIAFGGTGAVSDSLLANIISGNNTDSSGNLVPTNITAKSISANRIYLGWDSLINATSYNVYRASTYSGTYTKIASVSTPYYTDDNLSPGVTYFYKVQGVDRTGLGDYSNIVLATTQEDSTILPSPNNLVAAPLNSSKIELTWDTVANAISYNIYRTTADSGVYSIIDSVNRPYYVDENVIAGTAYFYKVQAVNNAGTGPYSPVVAVTALLSSNAPANVTATSLNSNQILVAWSPVNQGAYYNIYRSTSYNGNYTKLSTVSLSYFTDTGLSSGKTYYYKVQAVNNSGPGSYSGIVYAKTADQ